VSIAGVGKAAAVRTENAAPASLEGKKNAPPVTGYVPGTRFDEEVPPLYALANIGETGAPDEMKLGTPTLLLQLWISNGRALARLGGEVPRRLGDGGSGGTLQPFPPSDLPQFSLVLQGERQRFFGQPGCVRSFVSKRVYDHSGND